MRYKSRGRDFHQNAVWTKCDGGRREESLLHACSVHGVKAKISTLAWAARRVSALDHSLPDSNGHKRKQRKRDREMLRHTDLRKHARDDVTSFLIT